MAIGLVLIIWLVGSLSYSLWVIGIGSVIAIIFYPILAWMRRMGWPNVLATVVTSAMIIAIVVGIITIIFPPLFAQLGTLASNLPQQQSQIDALIETVSDRYLTEFDTTQLTEEVRSIIQGEVVGSIGQGVAFGLDTISFLFDAVLVFLVAFYALLAGHRVGPFIKKLIPRGKRKDLSVLGHEIAHSFKQYIIGQVIVSTILGIVTGVTLYILGTPFALLLGVFTGIAAAIPFLGAITAGFLATIIALTESLQLAFATLIAFIFIQQLEEIFVSPNVFSKVLGANPLIVIIAVIIGGELGGIPGMFLALPALAVLGALTRFWKKRIKVSVDRKLFSN